ncbi:hypothetical protein [Thalassobacillus hwangdonensis]|uniref:Uncharacterized protein n=1 Tax=Thalassobacillus hwangdonensis TaxID=546108 RepID=A0ABW3KYD8_9BACI
MRTTEEVNVNIHFHSTEVDDTPVIYTDGKGRIIAPGLVLASDNDGFDVYQYDRREGDIVHVYQDNSALFSVGYLSGGEQTRDMLNALIGDNVGLVDWIRAGVNAQ